MKLAQYRHEYSGQHSGSPPNDAATATEPAVCPAAVAIAAKPLAPIIGTSVCNVGTRAVNPAAIAGAAKPVVGLAEKFSKLEHLEYTTMRIQFIPPDIAINVPPVSAAAPMIPPRFQFSHLLLGDEFSRDCSSSFAAAIAEQATIISTASYNAKMPNHKAVHEGMRQLMLSLGSGE